jgi:hypothetical protein
MLAEIEDGLEEADVQLDTEESETEVTDAEETVEETEEEVTDPDAEETEDEEDEEDETEEDSEDETEEDGEEKEEEETEEEDDEPLIFHVKVDGKEQEVDEEELIRGYQTARSSTQRFSEAKKLHDEAKAFFTKFLEDPGTALTDYMTSQTGGNRIKARGLVRDQFLQWLAPDLEESLIEDERERELHRQKREIEEERRELERQRAESKSKFEKEAEEEFISDLRGKIDSQIGRFKLPNNDTIWQRAGKYLEAAQSAGSSHSELLDLVPTVMKQIADERKAESEALVKTLSAEELEALFPDQVQALKQRRIERVKKKKADKLKKKKAETEEKVPKVRKKKRERPKYFRSEDVFNSIDLDELLD